MITITFKSDEDEVTREFSHSLPNHSTWLALIEQGVIPSLRGLGYRLPETDDLMGAIEDCKDKML